MKNKEGQGRPRVLVIAGYDPCGGAGVLSDIKTIEGHGVYGYAVCTGMTWQNERTITRIQWYTEKDIFEQIDLCMASASFQAVKIGIAPSMRSIAAIVRHLRSHDVSIPIVWDPVMRASSGHDFWETIDTAGFEELAASCYLVTPNWQEMGRLYPGQEMEDCCGKLPATCNIYLKGGHHPLYPGRDFLWSGGRCRTLDPADVYKASDPITAAAISPKHGSGCVLSSSLAANLVLGYPLFEAAERSKRYIEQFLTSNQTLLGWHSFPHVSATSPATRYPIPSGR